jgi:hypothetical protein
MTRNGYDCTGGNAGWVRASLPLPDVMFWYGTGSNGIPWNESEKTLFPASIMVEIDQGGNGSPIMTAVVRDVESQAWPPGTAVNLAGWDVPRPTIYCARDSIPSVLADGWEGDIWLAWPGWNGEPLPDVGKCTIIGVQDVFAGQYDHTMLLDPTWPNVATADSGANSLSVTVTNRWADMAFDEVAECDHYVIQYESPNFSSPVLIMRALALSGEATRHLSDVAIPEASGGSIIVHAIVNGKAELIGTRTLP